MYPETSETILTAAQARLMARLLAVMDNPTAEMLVCALEAVAQLTAFGAVTVRRVDGHYRFVEQTVSNDTHK